MNYIDTHQPAANEFYFRDPVQVSHSESVNLFSAVFNWSRLPSLIPCFVFLFPLICLGYKPQKDKV